ncbi:MAG: helix-turn-helix transcriptional regulator [Selenomonadaceae bacterium]|nr:helix-turn-helix transcriptional regulator [Selenomonadaceae bacterium]MBQ3433702.1 helix-turn-helix transcriptional regulator [Selenomonadaceae bacterium]
MYANIRAEMARQGKTQTDIAKLLNISPNSLRWKLNGERPFLLDEVFTLAKTFNVSLDYLAVKSDMPKATA